MSERIVRIDELSDAIKKEIESMNQEVIEKVNEIGDKASKQAAQELKATSPVRHDGYKRKHPPGSYAKSWTVQKDSNVLGVTQFTVKNAKHYQLTHLLEFGHIDPFTGKRVGVTPHIAKVNDTATKTFLEEVERIKL